MRRDRYDDPYRDRMTYERTVLRPDWGRSHPEDPNWRDGHYHGMRSTGGAWQAAYARHRRDHRGELGDCGGYHGRYDRPMGGFDRDGLLRYEDRRQSRRHPAPPQGYDQDFAPDEAGWHGGGVCYDAEYLRQYNSRSPALREGYRMARGWDDRGHFPPPLREPTHEREYAGYNRGGWAPGTWTGPGTRSWNPAR